LAPDHSDESPVPPDLGRTAALLQRVREGDAAATDQLVKRFLPILRRWAHGRLPAYARDLSDTDDLVQITLIRALNHIGTFEPRREGAFLAYLRRILLNSLRDEIRRVNRQPVRKELTDNLVDPALVVDAVGAETMIAYEAALATLSERQQEAVILRVEFGYSYAEIAEATESASPNAARMMITRSLARLAEVMDGRET
jgi:RNA polymerase sigma-70 factor (ECF subfamily)